MRTQLEPPTDRIAAATEAMAHVRAGRLLATRSGVALPAALLGGALLGAVARWWMRLISDDPEFSWSGTIFIVVAFAVAAVGHAHARLARGRGRRRWSTPARLLGLLLTMPLFVGAGSMMLPTVFAGGLALWRTDWRRSARIAAAIVAVAVPVGLIVAAVRDGWELRVAVGLTLLVATYAIVIASFGSVSAPIVDGWRMPSWLRWLTITIVGAQAVGVALLIGSMVTAS